MGAPTVTQDGWCSDGCFSWGNVASKSARYTQVKTIPYKAAMNSAHYLAKGTFYTQMSYPLVSEYACYPDDDTKDCLVAIDTATGDIVSVHQSNSPAVYTWGPHSSDATVLVWGYGF